MALDVRQFERSIHLAIRDGAALLVTLVDGAQPDKVHPSLLQLAIAEVATSLGMLSDSQKTVTEGVHRKLEIIGRRLGLDESAWGTLAPKPV